MPARRRRLADGVRAWAPWTVPAIAAGLGAVAGSYLIAGRTPGFVVAPVDGFVVEYTPGGIVNWAIVELGDLGHQLAFATAIVLAALLLAVVALPGVLAVRAGRRASGAFLAALLVGMTALALTGASGASAGAAAGAGIVLTLTGLVPTAPEPDAAMRRRAIAAVGSAAGIGLLGLLVPRRQADGEVDVPDDVDPGAREKLDVAVSRSFDVAGLEPLVSTGFYEVDINNVNPRVDPEEWELSITGAVESERTVDFETLTGMESEDRFVTLRCVGDGLNGTKMDNALWTGVPVRPLLEDANPQGEYVMLRAADGYYNEFPIEALRPALLAYEMNGRPLPRGHGAPVRALVPGHWGEINVKWLTEIEVLDREVQGYWEKKGWHGTGPVNTVAKLWVTNRLDDGRLEVAGHTYAGTRGVDRVEVSTDGGDTWTEASLSDPLPGDDVWRQWVHRYEADRRHEVVVRAVDGTGTVQEREQSRAYPSGATGWVSKTVVP